MSTKKVCFLTILFSVCFVAGCTTNYVDKSKQAPSIQNPLTDAVFFEVNPGLATYEPRCINVLPFIDEMAMPPILMVSVPNHPSSAQMALNFFVLDPKL